MIVSKQLITAESASAVSTNQSLHRRGLELGMDLLARPAAVVHRGYRIDIWDRSVESVYELPVGRADLRVLAASTGLDDLGRGSFQPELCWAYFLSEENHLAIMPWPTGPIEIWSEDDLLKRCDSTHLWNGEFLERARHEAWDEIAAGKLPVFEGAEAHSFKPVTHAEWDTIQRDLMSKVMAELRKNGFAPAVPARPAPATREPQIRVALDGNTLCGRDRDGVELWRISFNSEVRIARRGDLAEPNNFYASDAWAVHCVNGRTGQVNWTWGHNNGLPAFIQVGESLYVTTGEHVHAINRLTGNVVWTTPVGGDVSALLYDFIYDYESGKADEQTFVVFIGTDSGTVLMLDRNTGVERWRTNVPGKVTRMVWSCGLLVDTVAYV